MLGKISQMPTDNIFKGTTKNALNGASSALDILSFAQPYVLPLAVGKHLYDAYQTHRTIKRIGETPKVARYYPRLKHSEIYYQRIKRRRLVSGLTAGLLTATVLACSNPIVGLAIYLSTTEISQYYANHRSLLPRVGTSAFAIASTLSLAGMQNMFGISCGLGLLAAGLGYMMTDSQDIATINLSSVVIKGALFLIFSAYATPSLITAAAYAFTTEIVAPIIENTVDELLSYSYQLSH